MNKKGQTSILAMWKVAVGIALFFPFMHFYTAIKPDLLAGLTSGFLKFLLIITPFVYWVAIAFLFVNTLRGVSS